MCEDNLKYKASWHGILIHESLFNHCYWSRIFLWSPFSLASSVQYIFHIYSSFLNMISRFPNFMHNFWTVEFLLEMLLSWRTLIVQITIWSEDWLPLKDMKWSLLMRKMSRLFLKRTSAGCWLTMKNWSPRYKILINVTIDKSFSRYACINL